MGTRMANQTNVPRGFTLIELLIVMGILTILATLSLTTVKGLLKDQKITQSAQLVREYIETARLRALTAGRPVAVFLERVSAVGGDASANPIGVAANYTTTRLSIGEVFPPYTGDELGVVGILSDSPNLMPLGAVSNGVTTRPADNYADHVTFSSAQVAAGFGVSGTPGFISIGDTIEFEGYAGRFTIESIDYSGGNTVVTFFNPPANYNFLRDAKALGARHVQFEATHAQAPPQIPLGSAGTLRAKFRVYRRPSKSLVGSVTLPRGICVDLFCSGFGPTSVNLPTSGFLPNVAANNLRTGNYSRVAVMFGGDGRLSSVFADDKGESPVGGQASQVLHLLVGKTDQVPVNAAELLSTRPADDRDGTFQSNLLDTENVWISCNPYTGEVNSSRVAAVTDPIIQAAIASNPLNVSPVVNASRALSIAGVRN